MDKLYRTYGGPFLFVLFFALGLFSYERLFYGLDLVAESANLISLRESLSPWWEYQFDILDSRRLVFLLQFALALVLGLCLRKDVSSGHMALAFALLFCFVPGQAYGLRSQSLILPALLLFQFSLWAWWQKPRRSLSLLIPFAGLLVLVADPIFFLYVFPLFILPFFKSKESGANLPVKLSYLASINFVFLILVALIMSIGPEVAAQIFWAERRWPLLGEVRFEYGLDFLESLPHIFPSAIQIFMWMAALLLSLLAPAKFFHPFFAALSILYFILGFDSDHQSVFESYLIFSIPLLLGHFMKVRRAIEPGEKIPLILFLIFAAVPLLVWEFGFQAMAMAAVPLFVLFFILGQLRSLIWGASFSALVVSTLALFAQYGTLPPGSGVRESIEKLDMPPYQGIWIGRVQKNLIDSINEDLKIFAGGPSSLYVFPDEPGFKLVTGLDSELSDDQNLADVLLILKKRPGEFVDVDSQTRVLVENPIYRLFKDDSRYQLYVKLEFLDQLGRTEK